MVRTTKYGKVALEPCPDAVNLSYYKSCIPLKYGDLIKFDIKM